MSNQDIHYPIEFTTRLEMLWGEGFLSPGGPKEVREILRDINLKGKTVLDIGCGTGGVELIMARDLGVKQVIAIDVEPQLIDITRERIGKAGLSQAVEVQLVMPGPLAFEDNTIDVVFSKDSMIHIEDKNEIFKEILRVLKPNGIFAASDWLVGTNLSNSACWKRYAEFTQLSFVPATADETLLNMQEAGFKAASLINRNSWYEPVTIAEVNALEGPLKEKIIAVSDIETYNYWINVRKSLRDVVISGDLRPTHLRGVKP